MLIAWLAVDIARAKASSTRGRRRPLYPEPKDRSSRDCDGIEFDFAQSILMAEMFEDADRQARSRTRNPHRNGGSGQHRRYSQPQADLHAEPAKRGWMIETEIDLLMGYASAARRAVAGNFRPDAGTGGVFRLDPADCAGAGRGWCNICWRWASDLATVVAWLQDRF